MICYNEPKQGDEVVPENVSVAVTKRLIGFFPFIREIFRVYLLVLFLGTATDRKAEKGEDYGTKRLYDRISV